VSSNLQVPYEYLIQLTSLLVRGGTVLDNSCEASLAELFSDVWELLVEVTADNARANNVPCGVSQGQIALCAAEGTAHPLIADSHGSASYRQLLLRELATESLAALATPDHAA
jgi:hypothetical protein